MLGNPASSAWRAWAEGSVFSPGRHAYNDFHSLDAAGSPYPASAYFCIKSLVGPDSTCMASFGFELARALPAICDMRVVAKDRSKPPPDDQV